MKNKVYKMYEKEIKTKCDECENEFNLNAVNIQKEKIQLNGVTVDLVFFACPECNKIYRVSIQDARYYDLSEDLERARRRMKRNKGSNNEETARMLIKMVQLKHQRLKQYVEAVNAAFPGTFTFVASENNPKDKIIKYLP